MLACKSKEVCKHQVNGIGKDYLTYCSFTGYCKFLMYPDVGISTSMKNSEGI